MNFFKFLPSGSRCWILLFLLTMAMDSFAQKSNPQIDSLKQLLDHHPKQDTVRIDLLYKLSESYRAVEPYQSVSYLREALAIARKIKHQQHEFGVGITLVYLYMEIGESVKSIEVAQSLLNLPFIEGVQRDMALAFISFNYKAQGDLDKALDYALQANRVVHKENLQGIVGGPWNLGDIYYKKNQLDSALKYGNIAFNLLNQTPEWVQAQFTPMITGLLNNIYINLNQQDSARYYSRYAYHFVFSSASSNISTIAANEAESQLGLAKCFEKWGPLDSAYWYGKKGYERANSIHNYDLMQQCAYLLKSAYEKSKQYPQALKYYDLAIAAKDSLQGVDKVKKTQAMHYDYQLKEQQLDDLKKQLSLKSRIRLLGLFALFFVLFAIFLYRSVHLRKKTIRTLNEQNKLIEEQKKELHGYLDELKEKQTQLIHAEKMASLGELTAGIAHEIQNPLNFVNNFSELNAELIEELKNEQAKSIRNGPLELETLDTLEENSKKILLHGKRAESIVRSMLEHSQTKPGEKTETNINTLTEEYLKLSYHAIRAKDKSINVNLITDLDPAIPNLKIIPADIGRVLINIFTNAFYSMNEKKSKSDESYSPSLSIRSLIHGKSADLIIKDNGLGIPEAVRSKIFQPFFTTKPTGNGTGLGLSLSYDIITKAHGGSISVESEEGKYCTFIINLPL
jgi:two-component system, NtrC family, sensor kinase